MRFTVSTKEELERLEEKISKLPDAVKEDIELAEMGMGGFVTLHLRDQFKNPVTIHLPNDVATIDQSKDYEVCAMNGSFTFVYSELYKDKPPTKKNFKFHKVQNND